VQVRVVRGLSDFREAVPNECVTVRREAFVLCRLRVQTEGVLDAHVGRTELGEIAEDAVTFGSCLHFHDLRGGDSAQGTLANTGPGD
jgi:hypothetical protein